MVCRNSVILKVYFSSFFSPGFAPYFRMSVLHDGLSEPEFYGDLVFKLKLIGWNVFSFQFRKKHYTLQTYRV